MSDLSKDFGKRLKEIRIMRGLTQSQLGELMNVETMTISRIETGLNFPKKENIELFAKILKVDVRDLFDFRHYETKKVLIDDINQILKKASVADVQFYKKVLCSHIESLK